ncbi:MAG: hypothetical protein JW800_02260 [Candidatus Omnitrophica bacterium]|nr:hypothetical protein [Candidatus Omnitrophota bacterium]
MKARPYIFVYLALGWLLLCLGITLFIIYGAAAKELFLTISADNTFSIDYPIPTLSLCFFLLVLIVVQRFNISFSNVQKLNKVMAERDKRLTELNYNLESSHKLLESEYKKVKHALDIQRKDNEELSGRNKNLESVIEEMRLSIEYTRDEIRMKMEREAVLQEAVAKLESSVKQFEFEVERLQDEKKQHMSLRDKVISQYIAVKEKLRKAEEELKTVRELLAKKSMGVGETDSAKRGLRRIDDKTTASSYPDLHEDSVLGEKVAPEVQAPLAGNERQDEDDYVATDTDVHEDIAVRNSDKHYEAGLKETSQGHNDSATEQLRFQISKHAAEEKKLKEANEKFRLANHELEQSLRHSKKAELELRNELEHRIKTIEALQADNKELRDINKDFEDSVSKYEKEKDNIDQLLKQLDEYLEINRKLKADNDKLAKKHEELEIDLEHVKIKDKSFAEEIRRKDAQIKELQSANKDLEEVNADFKSALNMLKREEKRLFKENQRMKHDAIHQKSSREKAKEREKERSFLAELKKKESRIKELQSANKDLEEVNADFKSALNVLKKEEKRLFKENQKMKNETMSLKKAGKMFKKEVVESATADQPESYAGLPETIGQLKSLNEKLKVTIEHLRSNEAWLSDELDKEKENRARLISENSILKKRIEEITTRPGDETR